MIELAEIFLGINEASQTNFKAVLHSLIKIYKDRFVIGKGRVTDMSLTFSYIGSV